MSDEDTAPDPADENAMRLLLDDRMDTQERIASARHLENSETEEAFTALLEVGHSAEEDEDLLRAVGRSLAKVAKALSREDEVGDLHPAARAAYGG